MFNGDHGEDMTSRRSCAGGREATRVCSKREARHEIASVVLLTRTSTCAPIDPWGRKEVAVTDVLEVVWCSVGMVVMLVNRMMVRGVMVVLLVVVVVVWWWWWVKRGDGDGEAGIVRI